MPGFEDRGETGVEAIESYVASFDDPGLGGALMRLCESARVDARSRGAIAAWRRASTRLNRALVEKLNPRALSTMLVRGVARRSSPAMTRRRKRFTGHAAEFFAPAAQAPAPTSLTSARQAGAMYTWLQELMAAARRAGASEGLDDDGNSYAQRS